MYRVRRRAHAPVCAWLISIALHLTLVSICSVLAQPRDLDKVDTLVLTLETVHEPELVEFLALAGEKIDGERADDAESELAFDSTVDTTALVAPTALMADRGASMLALADAAEASRVEIVPLERAKPPAQRRPPESSGRRAGFYGTVAYGDDFVYVLDMSGSMAGQRFESVCDELLRSVNALREDQSFYVMLFSNSTRRMFDDDALVPEPVRATPENKRRLRDWLNDVRPDGGTDPRDALRLALEVRPSAVFVLSDGKFQLVTSKRKKGRLRRGDSAVPVVVERHNRDRTPIHTFAYGSLPATRTMQELANQTGGEFRFIAVPKEHTGRRNSKPPPPSREQQALALLEQARGFEAAHEWMRALAHCRKIVESFPVTKAGGQAEELRQRLTFSP